MCKSKCEFLVLCSKVGHQQTFAKLIVKKIIEGDVDNQYVSIWRYTSELTRVNPRNTAKIIVERPCPSIQPRFGSFYFYF